MSAALWPKAGATINVRSRRARPVQDVGAAAGSDRAETVAVQSVVGDISQRHLLRRAATVGLLMRHCVNVGVAIIALLEGGPGLRLGGQWLMFAVVCWSIYRLTTRSQRFLPTAVDLGLTLAVCLAIPLLTDNQTFFLTNSAQQAIAGTAVISFSVSVPARVSLPITAAVAASYAWGAAAVIGWAQLGSVLAVFYFGLQWLTSALIRAMLLRVAAAVDRAREARESAELTSRVEHAVREFEREQLSLLHDTAASTLLMVGQGTNLPPRRIAAQARRDLDLLHEGPWRPPDSRVELVGALREAAMHVRTPLRFLGLTQVWLNGDTAHAVTAAAREVMTNVDRHARAGSLSVEIAADTVILTDDGVGFETGAVVAGHGIADSIRARMARVSGEVDIISAPGRGTSVQLHWPPAEIAPVAAVTIDPDRLIDRVRLIYACALTAYAIANLITTVPYAVAHAGRPVEQLVLGLTAAACALVALPALRGRPWLPAWVGLVVILVVTISAPLMLTPDRIGSQSDWAQGAIGWCAMPLALTLPIRRAATVLVGLWTIGVALELIRHPVASSLVNAGLGSASILGVQLFALAFDGLMRDAAADVEADIDAHKRLVIAERITRAVTEEYRRRYARLVDGIVPLLEQLSTGEPVSDELGRQARIESRHLRALFEQSRTFHHPMLQRLRPAVDTAEGRDVEVTVDVSGELPRLAPVEIDRLVTPLGIALAAAQASAHLVVTSASDHVNLSAVCRHVSDPEILAAQLESEGAEVVTIDDTVWAIVELRVGDGRAEQREVTGGDVGGSAPSP